MKASIPSVSKQNQGLNGHFDPQTEHNVMILAPNCSRFSLLPVTSSHSQRGRDKNSAKTLTASNLNSKTSITSSTATRKRSKSPVARAANSFFEAMSNSWFGTKWFFCACDFFLWFIYFEMICCIHKYWKSVQLYFKSKLEDLFLTNLKCSGYFLKEI